MTVRKQVKLPAAKKQATKKAVIEKIELKNSDIDKYSNVNFLLADDSLASFVKKYDEGVDFSKTRLPGMNYEICREMYLDSSSISSKNISYYYPGVNCEHYVYDPVTFQDKPVSLFKEKGVNDFVKLLDILLGATAVLVAPSIKYMEAATKVTAGNYIYVKDKFVYRGISPEVFMFSPQYTSLFLGIFRTALAIYCDNHEKCFLTKENIDRAVNIINNRDKILALQHLGYLKATFNKYFNGFHTDAYVFMEDKEFDLLKFLCTNANVYFNVNSLSKNWSAYGVDEGEGEPDIYYGGYHTLFDTFIKDSKKESKGSTKKTSEPRFTYF